MIIPRPRKNGTRAYQVRLEFRGRVYCETYDVKEDAVRAERELRRRLQTSHLPAETAKKTFADCATFWIENRSTKIAESSRRRYVSLLKTNLLPLFGGYRVSGLSARNVRDELEALQKKMGWSDGSYNKAVTTVMSVLSFAYREELIHENPLKERLPRKSGRSFVRRAPEPATVQGILRNLSQQSSIRPDLHWMTLATVFGSLSLRLSEVFALEVTDYDRAKRTIRIGSSVCISGIIKSTKTGQIRTLPIPERVCKLIERQIGLLPPGCRFLFPSPVESTKPRNPNMAGKSLRRFFREECGVGIDFHTLRHFAASQFPALGAGTHEAMSLTGHGDVRAFSGYFTAGESRQRMLLERHTSLYLPDSCAAHQLPASLAGNANSEKPDPPLSTEDRASS